MKNLIAALGIVGVLGIVAGCGDFWRSPTSNTYISAGNGNGNGDGNNTTNPTPTPSPTPTPTPAPPLPTGATCTDNFACRSLICSAGVCQ